MGALTSEIPLHESMPSSLGGWAAPSSQEKVGLQETRGDPGDLWDPLKTQQS